MKYLTLLMLVLPGCTTATLDGTGMKETNADLIIRAAWVVPITAEPIIDGAVAIRNGEIVAVGSAAEIDAAWSADERIDAGEAALLPGFVNAHTHAPMTLFRGIADDLPLMEWLQGFIFPAEAKNVDEAFVRAGTRLAAAEMISSGTTTFADMYYFESAIADETSKAGMRGVLGETVIDFPAPDNKSWSDAMDYVRRYAAEWKGHALITPAIAPHAPNTVSAEHLKEVRALASELGIPILIHLAETEDEARQVKERYGKRPVAHLEDLGFFADDVLVAHAIWLEDDEIALLKRRGVGAVHNPESNMMLASGVARVPELLAAGVDLGLGTDGPAGSNNNLDMLEEMASAARLQKISRKDPAALTADQVLWMATLGGARALDLDEKIGSIEVGKRADLITVDLSGVGSQPIYSVESAIVYASNGADVTNTVVDGKVLMRDRNVLTVDVAAAIEEAKRLSAKVRASLAE